jgi:hypothetical protein
MEFNLDSVVAKWNIKIFKNLLSKLLIIRAVNIRYICHNRFRVAISELS